MAMRTMWSWGAPSPMVQWKIARTATMGMRPSILQQKSPVTLSTTTVTGTSMSTMCCGTEMPMATATVWRVTRPPAAVTACRAMPIAPEIVPMMMPPGIPTRTNAATIWTTTAMGTPTKIWRPLSGTKTSMATAMGLRFQPRIVLRRGIRIRPKRAIAMMRTRTEARVRRRSATMWMTTAMARPTTACPSIPGTETAMVTAMARTLKRSMTARHRATTMCSRTVTVPTRTKTGIPVHPRSATTWMTTATTVQTRGSALRPITGTSTVTAMAMQVMTWRPAMVRQVAMSRTAQTVRTPMMTATRVQPRSVTTWTMTAMVMPTTV